MTVIDDLFKKVDPAQRSELERIRTLTKQLCPQATEVMTYGMPGFKYKDKYLLSFSGFQDHMSLFPGAEPVDLLKDKLKDHITSKGTIQFTLDTPLSDELLTEIIELCIARIDQ